MRADSQKFGHRRLVEAQPFSLQHELLRHVQIFHHAAITMNAEHADIAAAIAFALQAGAAFSARNIRNDGNNVADGQMAALRRLFNCTESSWPMIRG